MNLTLTKPDQIDSLTQLLKVVTPRQIVAAYSGSPGCTCGCRGKTRYSSENVEKAVKSRGYAVDEEEVSDRFVKTIVGKIISASAEYPVDVDVTETGALKMVAVETPTRLYILNLV